MKTLEGMIQGDPQWHAARIDRRGASEAAAMMGCGYISRDELLRQKATGIVPEVTPQVQRLFDAGHAAEAAARPLMEKNNLIGDDLYPVTAVHDVHDFLLASFDGITMMEDIVWEHKLWNEGLAERVRNNNLEPKHYWQLEQQLLVSGATRAVFTVSDGTEDNQESMEYYQVEGRAEELLAGWAQFQKDLESYTPQVEVVEPTASVIETLPSLLVEISGAVQSSNLALYKESALKFIRAINTDLQDDQDFMDAANTIKFCDKAEKELELVKKQALDQTVSISDLFRTIDTLKEEMRSKRLNLNKLVEVRKKAIRENVVMEANAAKKSHFDSLNERIGPDVHLPDVQTNFAGVIKGKRTVASLQGAVNDELARFKIEANEIADRIEANLKALKEVAEGYGYLFLDLRQIITKDREDLLNLAKMRVADHKKAEAEKAAQKLIDDEAAEKKRIDDENDAAALKEAQGGAMGECDTKTPEGEEKAPECAESAPETAKQEESNVATMPLRTQRKMVDVPSEQKTMMHEIASWSEAYRIPQEAIDELVLILESHVPEAASK